MRVWLDTKNEGTKTLEIIIKFQINYLVKNNQLPMVKESDTITKVIVEISEKRLGVTCVLNDDNKWI